MNTPDINDPDVVSFCEGVADSAPLEIPVYPQNGMEPLNCYNNVDAMVIQSGGNPLKGWHITIWPGLFIEAECHAVWQKGDGEIIDPTPHIHGFTKIAFVPDSTLGTWEFPDNVSLVIKEDPIIFDFLEGARLLRSQGGVANTLRHKNRYKKLVRKYGQEPFG